MLDHIPPSPSPTSDLGPELYSCRLCLHACNRSLFARGLSIDSHAYVISQHARRPIRTPSPTCKRENEVADALSRITINAVHFEEGIDYEQMAAEQRREGISISSNAPHLQELPVPNGTGTLVCNTKTGDPRPIVPSTFRDKVFNLLHNLSHPGIRATTNPFLLGMHEERCLGVCQELCGMPMR